MVSGPSLLARTWSGRERARRMTFADAVAEHQDEIFGAALRILGDRDAARDVTSATFMKAYRAFDRYDPGRPLRPWLLRIAVNEALSAGRARTRERARLLPEGAAETMPDRASGPEGRAIDREERDLVRAAVAALPERYRVPVVLRYFNDLSLEEIAQVTGRTANAVGVQLLRGRALLRKALAEPGV